MIFRNIIKEGLLDLKRRNNSSLGQYESIEPDKAPLTAEQLQIARKKGKLRRKKLIQDHIAPHLQNTSSQKYSDATLNLTSSPDQKVASYKQSSYLHGSPQKHQSSGSVNQTATFLRELSRRQSMLDYNNHEKEQQKEQKSRQSKLQDMQRQIQLMLEPQNQNVRNPESGSITNVTPVGSHSLSLSNNLHNTSGVRSHKNKVANTYMNEIPSFNQTETADLEIVAEEASTVNKKKKRKKKKGAKKSSKKGSKKGALAGLQIAKFTSESSAGRTPLLNEPQALRLNHSQAQNPQSQSGVPFNFKTDEQSMRVMSQVMLIMQHAQKALAASKTQTNEQYVYFLRKELREWEGYFQNQLKLQQASILKGTQQSGIKQNITQQFIDMVKAYIQMTIGQLNQENQTQSQKKKKVQKQDTLLRDLEIPFQRFWIDPNSKWYKRWTLFILILNLIWVQSVIPVRMSFESQRYIRLWVALCDLLVDAVFCLEGLSFFFIPQVNKDDWIGNVPYSMFKAFPKDASLDDMKNFFTFNFAYIPRFYIVCMALKLIRIRRVQKYMLLHLKLLKISLNKINLILTVWTLLLMLHLIACFWGVAGKFNLSTNLNWIYAQNLQDSDMVSSYLTSLYWASVTIMTVGYGDILPMNSWETSLVCVIFVIGVAMFSYTLSALANQFSDLSRSRSKRQNRDKQLHELQHKFKLPQHLIDKINYYFSQTDTVIGFSRDYEMNSLLKVLPPNLKTRLALFLYHDAISTVPFLQNRDQTFYLNYLDLLIPLKFQKHTMILKEGTRPEEVFLILTGFVQNCVTKRALGPGSLIGETDFKFKRERAESFVAITDVFVLKYEISVFESILDQFADIKAEIDLMARKREKMRLLTLGQETMIEEQEQHKQQIFQNLKMQLKKGMGVHIDLKTLASAFKGQLRRDNTLNERKTPHNLTESQKLMDSRKMIDSKSFSSDRAISSIGRSPGGSNGLNISTGRAENVSRNMRSQLEQIDEIRETLISNQKSDSDQEDDNKRFKQIFQDNGQPQKKNSTFQQEDIHNRLRQLSQRKLDQFNNSFSANNSGQNSPRRQAQNSGSSMTNDQPSINQNQLKPMEKRGGSSIQKNSTKHLSKVREEDKQEQEVLLTSSGEFKKGFHASPQGSRSNSRSNLQNLGKQFASGTSSPSNNSSHLFKKNQRKQPQKRHSSLDGDTSGRQHHQNMDPLFESHKYLKLEFLSQQDAIFYSNPEIKKKTLKSRVYDSLELEQMKEESNEQSSFLSPAVNQRTKKSQQSKHKVSNQLLEPPSINLQQRDKEKKRMLYEGNAELQMSKVNTMIKKSKLILNEYGKKFSAYLEKLRQDNKNTVSAHIVLSTRSAIVGIKKYNQILSEMEQKLESPSTLDGEINETSLRIAKEMDMQKRFKQQLLYILSRLEKKHQAVVQSKQMEERPVENQREDMPRSRRQKQREAQQIQNQNSLQKDKEGLIENQNTANQEISARYSLANENKSLIRDERSYAKAYSPDPLIASDSKLTHQKCIHLQYQEQEETKHTKQKSFKGIKPKLVEAQQDEYSFSKMVAQNPYTFQSPTAQRINLGDSYNIKFEPVTSSNRNYNANTLAPNSLIQTPTRPSMQQSYMQQQQAISQQIQKNQESLAPTYPRHVIPKFEPYQKTPSNKTPSIATVNQGSSFNQNERNDMYSKLQMLKKQKDISQVNSTPQPQLYLQKPQPSFFRTGQPPPIHQNALTPNPNSYYNPPPMNGNTQDLNPKNVRKILEQNGLNNFLQQQNSPPLHPGLGQMNGQIAPNFTINLYNNTQVIYQQQLQQQQQQQFKNQMAGATQRMRY